MTAPGRFELEPHEAALDGVRLGDGVLHLGPSGAHAVGLAVTAAVAGLAGSIAVGVLAGLGLFGRSDGGDPSPGAWAVQLLLIAAVTGWWWRAAHCEVRADDASIEVQRSTARAVRVAHVDVAEIRVARHERRGEPATWEMPEVVRRDGSVVRARPLAARVAHGAVSPAAARAELLRRFHRAQLG